MMMTMKALREDALVAMKVPEMAIGRGATRVTLVSIEQLKVAAILRSADLRSEGPYRAPLRASDNLSSTLGLSPRLNFLSN